MRDYVLDHGFGGSVQEKKMKITKPKTLMGWMIWATVILVPLFAIFVAGPVIHVIEHFVMKYW